MESAVEFLFGVESGHEPVFDESFIIWSDVWISLIRQGLAVSRRLPVSGSLEIVTNRDLERGHVITGCDEPSWSELLAALPNSNDGCVVVCGQSLIFQKSVRGGSVVARLNGNVNLSRECLHKIWTRFGNIKTPQFSMASRSITFKEFMGDPSPPVQSLWRLQATIDWRSASLRTSLKSTKDGKPSARAKRLYEMSLKAESFPVPPAQGTSDLAISTTKDICSHLENIDIQPPSCDPYKTWIRTLTRVNLRKYLNVQTGKRPKRRQVDYLAYPTVQDPSYDIKEIYDFEPKSCTKSWCVQGSTKPSHIFSEVESALSQGKSVVFPREGGHLLAALVMEGLKRCSATVFTIKEVKSRTFTETWNKTQHPRAIFLDGAERLSLYKRKQLYELKCAPVFMTQFQDIREFCPVYVVNRVWTWSLDWNELCYIGSMVYSTPVEAALFARRAMAHGMPSTKLQQISAYQPPRIMKKVSMIFANRVALGSWHPRPPSPSPVLLPKCGNVATTPVAVIATMVPELHSFKFTPLRTPAMVPIIHYTPALRPKRKRTGPSVEGGKRRKLTL